MPAIPRAWFLLSLFLSVAPGACSRRTPAPPPPVTVAADAAPEAEADSPLAVCQRACSDGANQKQLAAFERCDAESKAAARDACRARALTATDDERIACRRACQDRQGAGRDR